MARNTSGERTSYGLNGTTQSISITASSAAISNAVSANSHVVRLYLSGATNPCFVRSGSSPTAVTTDMPIAPGIPEYFNVPAGEKIAAIGTGSDGTLYVTEVK